MPKDYIMYQFEKYSNQAKKENRRMEEDEFYEKTKIRKYQVVQYYNSFEELEETSEFTKGMKQSILRAVKRMAKDLRRTPTQTEFEEEVGRHYFRRYFGSYNNLLKVAELEPNKEGVGRKKNG